MLTVSAVLLMGCTDVSPRAQWVVIVDTDALLTGQLSEDLGMPSDAALDSLRIDVIAESGQRLQTREFTVPDPRDWPLSFGVVADGPKPERLRLRAFAGGEGTLDGDGLLEPAARLTIDRLVTFNRAPDGREELGIRLSMACLGVRPSFVRPPTTCVDGERLEADPASGRVEITHSLAGTSPLLATAPCQSEAPPGAVCIPGGFSVMGDEQLSGLEDAIVADAAPALPVIISPFWMDRTEVTVGSVRALYAAGLTAEEPAKADPNTEGLEYCSWRGRDDAAGDHLPITCFAVATAEAICAARGGRLPTEAEWEHAAGGRGDGRRYPWGDVSGCCGSQLGRWLGPCSPAPGPAPAGTFSEPPNCPFADRSLDGVLDLGGNLVELTSGPAEPYDAPCWSFNGIARDPRCLEGDDDRVARGGAWTTGLAIAHTAHRKIYILAHNAGVRCVYDDRP